MSARPATPPITPPTMLPIFASPLLGIVSPPSESPGSGPMSPAAASPGEKEGTGLVVVCGLAARGVFTDVGSRGEPTVLGSAGSTAMDDRRMADSAAAGDVKKGAGSEDRLGDEGRAAVGIVSELVDAGTVGTAVVLSVVATATCDATAATTGLLFSTGFFGPAAAGSDGTRFASGTVGASGMGTALIVPIAEETAASGVVVVIVGASTDCSAAGEEG
jgi:hypothetical protein